MTRTQIRPGRIGGVATRLLAQMSGNVGALQPEDISPKPTRDEVISQMLIEANISRQHGRPFTRGQCDATLNWIQGFVNRSRRRSYDTQYPTDAQMDTVEYRIFDYVTPHGAAAKPGSAADLVNQLLLDPNKNEISIWHDTQPDGNGVYCTIKVSVGKF